jgi:hypothetical protein
MVGDRVRILGSPADFHVSKETISQQGEFLLQQFPFVETASGFSN